MKALIRGIRPTEAKRQGAGMDADVCYLGLTTIPTPMSPAGMLSSIVILFVTSLMASGQQPKPVPALAPTRVPDGKGNHPKTAGELYISKIKPAENAGNFNDAFSESMLIMAVYKNSKRSNRVDKSSFIENRNQLTRAYALLLSLKEPENGGGEKILLREVKNCGDLLSDLIDQFTDTQ